MSILDRLRVERRTADHPHLVRLLADPLLTGGARERIERDLDRWRRGETCSKGCRDCAAGTCLLALCGHDDCRMPESLRRA